MSTTVKEPVSVDADWRQRVKTERRCAKQFGEDYGFMTGTQDSPETSTSGRQTAAAKYYGTSGGWIVRQKALPVLPGQEQPDQGQEAEAPETRGPTGHLTARSATNLSHSQRLGELNESQGLFVTSNKSYGARLPIEQFGVAQFAIQSSSITDLKKA